MPVQDNLEKAISVETKDENLKQGIVDLIVAKHRNGATDTIKLKFIREHTTFTNINKDSDAESLEKSMPAERKITIEDIKYLEVLLND